jgi:uncharacterized membrane protein YeaQ/YmgE (transglycosylase-associated protein family)
LLHRIHSRGFSQPQHRFTMSFVYMLIIGLVVGAIAKLLTPGKDPGGCIITMILGIVGAMLAGFLGRAMGWYGEGEPAGFIASVIGAIIVLLIYRMITGRRRP